MTMPDQPAPVVLELAPLPREQLGPFLILGIEKVATREQIEAAWAQRVIAARKNQAGVSLEDINWAREAVNDPDRRLRCHVTSLNLDTADGVVHRLAERYGTSGAPTWPPFDAEKSLADHTPAVDVPRTEEVRQTVTVPEMPDDLPAIAWLLKQIVEEPLDPWALPLPPEPEHQP
jgi:hypothetical protein